MWFQPAKAIAEHLTGEALMGAKSAGEAERPLREEVARLAHELYERRGRVDGNDVDDWLLAEAELRRHYA